MKRFVVVAVVILLFVGFVGGIWLYQSHYKGDNPDSTKTMVNTAKISAELLPNYTFGGCSLSRGSKGRKVKIGEIYELPQQGKVTVALFFSPFQDSTLGVVEKLTFDIRPDVGIVTLHHCSSKWTTKENGEFIELYSPERASTGDQLTGAKFKLTHIRVCEPIDYPDSAIVGIIQVKVKFADDNSEWCYLFVTLKNNLDSYCSSDFRVVEEKARWYGYSSLNVGDCIEDGGAKLLAKLNTNGDVYTAWAVNSVKAYAYVVKYDYNGEPLYSWYHMPKHVSGYLPKAVEDIILSARFNKSEGRVLVEFLTRTTELRFWTTPDLIFCEESGATLLGTGINL